MNLNSQLTSVERWNKKFDEKWTKKGLRSTKVNCQTCDPNNEMEITS
jgi:anti-sigma factor ChrR (cupin superfamily)